MPTFDSLSQSPQELDEEEEDEEPMLTSQSPRESPRDSPRKGSALVTPRAPVQNQLGLSSDLSPRSYSSPEAAVRTTPYTDSPDDESHKFGEGSEYDEVK